MRIYRAFAIETLQIVLQALCDSCGYNVTVLPQMYEPFSEFTYCFRHNSNEEKHLTEFFELTFKYMDKLDPTPIVMNDDNDVTLNYAFNMSQVRWALRLVDTLLTLTESEVDLLVSQYQDKLEKERAKRE